VLQSQSASIDQCWGTNLAGADGPGEARDLNVATITIDGKDVKPEPGGRDLPDGQVVMNYPIGKGGQKTVTFGDEIAVRVLQPGHFVEQLPLLVNGEIAIKDGKATAAYPKGTLTIEFQSADMLANVRQTRLSVAGKQLVVLELPSLDKLTYRIHFDAAPGR
jgi:hypothetical protein